MRIPSSSFFFFNDTATTEIYTLSLHDALPIWAFKLRGAFNAMLSLPEDARVRGVVAHSSGNHAQAVAYAAQQLGIPAVIVIDRKSTRLNSSHANISYAVFCLKKKKQVIRI